MYALMRSQPPRTVVESASTSGAAPCSSQWRCGTSTRGTGNIVEAVRHLRSITGELRRLAAMEESELPTAAKDLRAPLDLVRDVAARGRLPVGALLRWWDRHPGGCRARDAAGRRRGLRGLGHLQVVRS